MPEATIWGSCRVFHTVLHLSAVDASWVDRMVYAGPNQRPTCGWRRGFLSKANKDIHLSLPSSYVMHINTLISFFTNISGIANIYEHLPTTNVVLLLLMLPVFSVNQ